MLDITGLTHAQVVAAIRAAYQQGREAHADEIRQWIGPGAVTLSADALRSEVSRRVLSGHSSRLREGVDPSEIRYDTAQPSLPDGSDPYEDVYWGVAMSSLEGSEVRRAVEEALDHDRYGRAHS